MTATLLLDAATAEMASTRDAIAAAKLLHTRATIKYAASMILEEDPDAHALVQNLNSFS